MTYTDYAAQADEYRRTAQRHYQQHRKQAQDAARFYQMAASRKEHPRWLEARHDLWTDEVTPAVWYDTALSLERVADSELRSSMRNYGYIAFYRDLQKKYQAWADEQAARIAEWRAEHGQEGRGMTPQERAEEIRREMLKTGQAKADLAAITDRETIRQMLASRYHGAVEITDEMIDAVLGQTWDTEQLQADFTVIGYSAPYCVVRRKSDQKVGTLEFTGGFGSTGPRVYFSFEETG
jgi:hypothetical protein